MASQYSVCQWGLYSACCPSIVWSRSIKPQHTHISFLLSLPVFVIPYCYITLPPISWQIVVLLSWTLSITDSRNVGYGWQYFSFKRILYRLMYSKSSLEPVETVIVSIRRDNPLFHHLIMANRPSTWASPQTALKTSKQLYVWYWARENSVISLHRFSFESPWLSIWHEYIRQLCSDIFHASCQAATCY